MFEMEPTIYSGILGDGIGAVYLVARLMQLFLSKLHLGGGRKKKKSGVRH